MAANRSNLILQRPLWTRNSTVGIVDYLHKSGGRQIFSKPLLRATFFCSKFSVAAESNLPACVLSFTLSTVSTFTIL